METRYLIAVGGDKFLFSDRGASIRSTPVLSLATSFTDYPTADYVARHLRQRGFAGFVTDVEGEPVTRAHFARP